MRIKNLIFFKALPLLILPLLLSGCSMALMDPKGEVGSEIKSLIITAFWLMMIVVIPVIVMTFLFAWRYRNTNYKAKYTPNWAHSNVIEAIVWFVPLVIIAFLAIITWQTSHSLNPNVPIDAEEGTEPMEIDVVALDWKWLFIYPDLGIASVNEVAFPVDTPVQFNITSGTVMNAFMIPRLGSQLYAMAGMDNELYLIANEEGIYPGRSTNFSGAGFSEMIFAAQATSQEGFEAWVEKVRQSSETLSFEQGYEELAAPSVGHPVEYFSNVPAELYDNIVMSFKNGTAVQPGHSGGHGGHGGGHAAEQDEHGEGHDVAMSAEVAE
ncbi:ubiquinol oxidase subunit II [Halomonas sp. McH1-25]|uniref:ubiquinol oxidase subunit II n=2 Tax=unclassified Halomonas TaxID=2609666 RepID=UPI001EF47C15|nr:ubiquinol oxidase subunit II [Halomonas sp. McH1-25]MCG7600526.1 ubiquinol oxidase subunit II [Halomonas sp. McH1-25]